MISFIQQFDIILIHIYERIASLEKSSEGLPLHLALVSDQDAQEVTGETQLTAQERQFTTLLGCSSLAKVVDPNLSNSVLIENGIPLLSFLPSFSSLLLFFHCTPSLSYLLYSSG